MLDAHPPAHRTVFIEVAWSDPRAVRLRRLMDRDTQERYNPGGARTEPADFVAKRTAALAVAEEQVVVTLLALDEDGAVGHLALRRLSDEYELKRLFVLPRARGTGVAKRLLAAAEDAAVAAGARRVILQTGDRQPEAIALYTRAGYSPIPVYEPYRETMPRSLCFEKVSDALDPREG